jgi:DNA-binding transcriptional MerR regulator
MAKNHTGRAKKHHDLSPVSLTVSSPKFEAPTLTVGQIAERLCKLNPDKAATKERVRHWTREDLLAPVAKHHEGTGRHRGYAEDSVYDAAVLSVIANAGLHITAHRYLLRGLPLVRQALQKWEAAKSGGRLFLEISHTKAGSPTITIHEGTVTPNPTARLSMLLNLTQIFSEVC